LLLLQLWDVFLWVWLNSTSVEGQTPNGVKCAKQQKEKQIKRTAPLPGLELKNRGDMRTLWRILPFSGSPQLKLVGFTLPSFGVDQVNFFPTQTLQGRAWLDCYTKTLFIGLSTTTNLRFRQPCQMILPGPKFLQNHWLSLMSLGWGRLRC
jgi:hypothetical protein